ncbi:MAG TPA: AraC family transcriptional regulator [Bacteroidetes bacterium]|nr:AraC family transcriptional regulator [Bacteroidota bacterium]
MEMIFVAGIGIAVLIEFLLLSKKNKSAADQILTVWMFLILLHLFTFFLYFTEKVVDFPFMLGIEQPLPLFHGVFLYFYVSVLTNQLPENRKLMVLHFLPIVLTYAYLASFILLPVDQKIQIYRNHGAGYEWFVMVKGPAMSAYGLFYVIWSALLLRNHEVNIRDQFSDLAKVDLHWLRILTYGLGVIWLLVVFFKNDLLTFTGVVVFVFLIGFFGIRQGEIFTHGPLLPENPEEKKKYPKSGLTEDASTKLHQALIQLMSASGLYKNAELSIDDLAAKLGVHPNYLSQVINQRENKNFYDFVNTYRVAEFKRLISMPRNQHLTLLSVAFDCGFNSKSSFNRYFKKATGQTPSEYFTSLTKDQSASSL